MENNQNTDNLGPENSLFALTHTVLPEWLKALMKEPSICNLDINNDIIAGYPLDDDF